MLIWLENAERHWKRRDEESCVAVCCFTKTTHLLTPHHKHGLPSEMPVSNCSITHRIHQTWPQVTSVCFQNWRNSWKDGNSLMMRMLSTLQVADQIKNSSTMESRPWRNSGPSAFLLEGTMLKSDKITCAYSIVNCVKLRTFLMPLVHVWSTSGPL